MKSSLIKKILFYLCLLFTGAKLNSSVVTNTDKFIFNIQCIRVQKCEDTDMLETYVHSASGVPTRNTNSGEYFYYGPNINYVQVIPNQEWWEETNRLNAFNLTNYFKCNYNSFLIFESEKYTNTQTNITVIISNNGWTSFTQTASWCGEEKARFWIYNVLGEKICSTNWVVLTVHCHPHLNVVKYVKDTTLNGVPSRSLPGCSVEYKIYYTNASTFDGHGTNVIIRDKLPLEVGYLTNSATTTNNWIIEFSTNATPIQTYDSGDYKTNEPPPSKVKWIRWKKPVVSPCAAGCFYFKVVIK